MGVNYGQILGLLLGTAGLTALGAHTKANKLNAYEDMLNNNLQTQGAPTLPFKHRNFAFGDYGDQQTADKGLYDQALKAYQEKNKLGDLNSQADQYHLPRFASSDVAEKTLAPYNSQDAQFKVGGQYGPQALKGQMYLQSVLGGSDPMLPAPQLQPPAPYTQGIPAGVTPGGTPAMDNSEMDSNGKVLQIAQPKILSASAQQSVLPEMPEGAYITPEMVKTASQEATTKRGQDMTAQTAANQLGEKVREFNEQAPNRAAQLRKLNADIQQVGIKNSYLAQLLRSEINRNNRSGSSGGKPSYQEQFDAKLAQGVKQGLWTADEAVQAQRIHMGIQGKPKAIPATQAMKVEQQRSQAQRMLQDPNPQRRQMGRRILKDLSVYDNGSTGSAAASSSGGGLYGFSY